MVDRHRHSATNLTLPWRIDQYRSASGASYALEGASTDSVIPIDVTDLPKNDYHCTKLSSVQKR